MKSIIIITRFSVVLFAAILLLSLKCDSNTSASKTAVPEFLSEKQFNELFPMRDKFYTYPAFIKALREMANIKVKVVRRGVSIYQFTRTDKATGKSTIIRQDEDWNEAWAKKKPDSSYVIDYGLFCSEKDLQTSKKELAAFFAHIAHETRHGQNGSYNDGLMYIRENNTSSPYISDNDAY